MAPSPNSGHSAPKLRSVGIPAPVRHALRGLAVLAAAPDVCFDISQVARRFDLPEAGLAKIFQQLGRRGLLESRRGPGGGYRLARRPEEITLADVAAALELDAQHGRCLLEERPCRPEVPCALHDAALAANALMLRELERLTLADFVPPYVSNRRRR